MTRKSAPASAPAVIKLRHGLVAHVILRDQLDLLIKPTNNTTEDK